MNQARRFGDRTLTLAKRAGIWEPVTWRESLEALPAGVMGLVALGFKKGDTVESPAAPAKNGVKPISSFLPQVGSRLVFTPRQASGK
jgi:hypothetical protein